MSTTSEVVFEEQERILRALENALENARDRVGDRLWERGYEDAIDDVVAIVRGEA